VTFTATFSEWVDNVDPTDFALTGDGITGAAVGEVVGDGTVFTITVDAGTGDGTLGLTIDPGTDITDSVGNGLVVTPTNREEYTIDRTAPQVSEVLAAGSGWGQSFLDYLAAEGLGDGGYAIAGDGGQLAPLPWSNTDQLIVRFTEPVDVELNDLDLIGVNTSQYTPQSIETRQLPDGRFEAKWRLESALAVDKLLAHLASDAITDPAGNPLDGEWSNGAQLGPSGDGQPGGDFDFRFNALPGDIDRDAFVGVLDINPMRNGLGKAAGQSGYDSAADLDGDGFIGVLDINPLRDGLGTSLPTEEPEVPQTTGDRFAEMADLVFGSLADDDDEDEDETDGPLTIESTLATSL